MQTRFLLGPAGSGKTFRCVAEIQEALAAFPAGDPLVLLAPKQATFQLERQLLEPCSGRSLAGYSRLRVLSFDRLAEFIFDQLGRPYPQLLSDSGRVMVLRALLAQTADQLKIFRASGRLPGFAQQLSQLLREFQRCNVSPGKLAALAARLEPAQRLNEKVEDLALLLGKYQEWLHQNELEDADSLLNLAAHALSASSQQIESGGGKIPPFKLGGLWLDGFAEMTPQELELLAALAPCCEQITLAFCLEEEPQDETSWLSVWSVVGQTYRTCYNRLKGLPGNGVKVEVMVRDPERSRFSRSPVLAHLEKCWTAPTPFRGELDAGVVAAGVPACRRAEASSPAEAALRDSQPDPDGKMPPSTSGKMPDATLHACAGPEHEAILTARQIREYVRGGGRYRDCAVLVRQLDLYHEPLRRIFSRYEIPFFLDRRESVAHHPVAELTRYALRTVAFDWQHDDWFGALKTGLVWHYERDLDKLENAALARGWKGRMWLQPFPSPEFDPEEKLRQQIVPPFQELAEQFSRSANRPTGSELAAALQQFWARLEIQERLGRWAEQPLEQISFRPPPAAVHHTVWTQLQEWVQDLARAFPEVALELRDWFPILEAGLSGLTVGVIPPSLDQVLIGAIDRSRNPDLQHAFLLGLNEAVFPAPPPAPVLLSETDRERLGHHDLHLGPTARQRLGHERFYGYIACTRSRQHLHLSYAERDAQDRKLNPSPFIAHLQRLFPALIAETFAPEFEWTQATHASELVARLLALDATQEPGAAPTCAPPAWQSVAQWPVFVPVLARARQFRQSCQPARLTPETAAALYGNELTLSVSALEDFAACPFKFFVSRGLRARERMEFEVDARHTGTFQHEVLSEFQRRVKSMGKRWRDFSPPDAGALAEQIANELLPAYADGLLTSNAANRFAASTLITNVRRLIEVLVAWSPQNEFEPHVVEIAFGMDDGLPAWRIELGDGQALRLRGRIDRVDLYQEENGEALCVVMDYKSSARKLDPVKLYHGLELQLLSYLGVLRGLRDPKTHFGVETLRAAGVFYVPMKLGANSGASRKEVFAKQESALKRAYEHTGRFSAAVTSLLDNRNTDCGDQFRYKINKNGELGKQRCDALPPSDFDALIQRIEDHLRAHGQAILAGEAQPDPFRNKSETACAYCDFKTICRFDPWVHPYRTLRPPSA